MYINLITITKINKTSKTKKYSQVYSLKSENDAYLKIQNEKYFHFVHKKMKWFTDK